MLEIGERDDDFFDFTEQILGEPTKETHKEEEIKMESVEKVELNFNTEIQTSYLLVNALLNLLIRKGVIHHHEVNALVAELHADYMKKKRGQGE